MVNHIAAKTVENVVATQSTHAQVGLLLLIRALLCGHPLVISLSIHLSILRCFGPSVCPRSLVQSITCLPLAQSGSYVTQSAFV